MWDKKIYYHIKPFIPRRVQVQLRRMRTLWKLNRCADVWPIDIKAAHPPQGWAGWPDGKRFALVLTHDVERAGGHEKCRDLAAMEKKLGFRSSYNFVAGEYVVSPELRQHLTDGGFEVGLHGITHDGKLYISREGFRRQAVQINEFLREWRCVGFRSPAMHHVLEWIHDLNIEYDASTFDTDPFEPQPDGMGTIFPFWVGKNGTHRGYVELPYTLPQDFTLFVILRERTVDIWKRKLDWIAAQGGMALVITHPDYMNFNGTKAGVDEYPAHYYEQLLDYVKKRYAGEYWQPLPKEISRFWSERYGRRA